jgi:hypothetical protein
VRSRCRIGLAVGGAGKSRFGMNGGAITNEPEMSSAGAGRGADGQNVAALGVAAGSLWLAGFEPGPTALSAPAT